MRETATASTHDARVEQREARASLAAVIGMPVDRALDYLAFSPVGRCPAVMRVLGAAVEDIRGATPGVTAADLVVSGGEVGDGDVVTRVRRHAHGTADWISTHTTAIRVEVALAEAARCQAVVEQRPVIRLAEPPTAVKPELDEELLEVLRDGVIDPDLGVNVVDLGFVRDFYEEEESAVLVMTLTSPACPVTGVLEDMVRTSLAPVIEKPIRVEWSWSPVWQPSDITESGKQQLGAIGFSFA